jgi:hypothetical protein
MKIAIYPNHGGVFIPSIIQKQLTEVSWIKNRIKMASIIENLSPTHDKITQKIYDNYEQSNDKNVYYLKDITNPNWIYVKNFDMQFPYVIAIKIVDVDTTRIWRLSGYDGAENIEYFGEPKIIDAELNYAEW